MAKCKCELKNFPFKYEGKTYWYSRSCATVGYVFVKHNIYGWCVLANKRGTGCPTNVGKWNVPCGYIEHNINGRDNCIKEIKEETGLELKAEQLKFLWIDTKPDKGKQNINISYYCIVNKSVYSFQLSDKYSEPNEVEEIKWIPISDIEKYDFAFNQKEKIKIIYNKYLNINYFKRFMIKLTEKLTKKYLIGTEK